METLPRAHRQCRNRPPVADRPKVGTPHYGAEGTVVTMAKREKDSMYPSFQAETLIGARLGALIVAMFGAGRLG